MLKITFKLIQKMKTNQKSITNYWPEFLFDIENKTKNQMIITAIGIK